MAKRKRAAAVRLDVMAWRRGLVAVGYGVALTRAAVADTGAQLFWFIPALSVRKNRTASAGCCKNAKLSQTFRTRIQRVKPAKLKAYRKLGKK
ncbi:hypothetical protein P3T18_006002 [Paraburkholderia sp. GAS199]|uniref:hypothetical protein n=1 Tax=Paraburkholderia sp. GAS199 TaxID=3035126 RepID=UPI003D1B25D1